MVSCHSVDGQLFNGWLVVVQRMVHRRSVDDQLSFSDWSVVQWMVSCSVDGQVSLNGGPLSFSG